MDAAAMKYMTSNFVKLDKFKGVDFIRWQKKMHLLLSNMSVVYVLTSLIPEDELWDSLEAKYMAEDASTFTSTSKLNDLILWHARLGHVHFKRMQDMSKDGLISSFDMDTEKRKTCMLNKITNKSFQNVKRETEVLELIHSDLCDLHATPSLGNKKYFVTFIDDASRFCYVSLLHTKDEALDKLKVFKTEVELQQGSQIQRFMTNKRGLSQGFCGEAMLTTCYLLNRVLNKRNMITPYELWTKRKPNLNYLRVWGCRAVVRLPDPKLKLWVKEALNASLLYTLSIPRLLGTMLLNLMIRVAIDSIIELMGLTIPLMRIDSIQVPRPVSVFLNGMKTIVVQSGKFYESGKGVVICLYVDDMLIFGTNKVQVNLTKEFLSSSLSVKDMWGGDVILVSTPMDTSEKLMPNNGQAVSQLEYSRVIGCLMYAMTCTRPDITFVVGKLSRYTSNPGTQHWQAIQRVRKYLKKTMDYRLTYTGYLSVLEGYTDVSWISNTEDNSSTSGWVFMLAAGKKVEWLINLLLDIPLWSKPIAPISILCDSAATLAKAYSQMYNGKSRHLCVRHSMIRELIMNGVTSIVFVRSQQNLADHLTKGLARDLVLKSAKGMGLKSNEVTKC
ncbi:zinc finger, CCHC-type containing protein [Tanacetum coccineum]